MSESRPLSLRLYALAASSVAPVAPIFLAGRARRGKEEPGRLGERLGHASLRRPDGRLVWMHGASVGEGLSLPPLVARCRELSPNASILVTTGTRASAQVLAQRLPAGAFHQFAPIDTPDAVARFLGHWRPDLGVFVESELWPNLIWAATAAGVPLALVSAKMSAESARTWRRFAGAARATLGAFDVILARDQVAGERFADLGGRVDGIWDAKLGASPLPVNEAEFLRLRQANGDHPVILAASTHRGEEAMVARAFADAFSGASAVRLIVVPRHPDRGPEVEQAARDQGLTAALRSHGGGPGDAQVLVADTLGELGLWYRLAMLAVVGGGLVEGIGGHNPLEPARLGCPFIAGSHVEHWPIYRDLVDAGATALMAGPDDLVGWMGHVLADPSRLRAMADRATAFVRRRDEEGQAVAERLLALSKA
jgi:3-deoxy-D-manno-octulosonic-acid transferase